MRHIFTVGSANTALVIKGIIIIIIIMVIIIIVVVIIIIIISTRLQVIMNGVYESYVNYFSCMYTYISFYTCHILSSVAIGNMYTSTILQHKHT